MATKQSLESLLARKGELQKLTDENDTELSKALAAGGVGKIYLVNGFPHRACSRQGGPLYLRCMVPADGLNAMAGKPASEPTKKVLKKTKPSAKKSA